jgi:hypothetical protein
LCFGRKCCEVESKDARSDYVQQLRLRYEVEQAVLRIILTVSTLQFRDIFGIRRTAIHIDHPWTRITGSSQCLLKEVFGGSGIASGRQEKSIGRLLNPLPDKNRSLSSKRRYVSSQRYDRFVIGGFGRQRRNSSDAYHWTHRQRNPSTWGSRCLVRRPVYSLDVVGELPLRFMLWH